ncbi:recombinase family protein [Gordonia sp. NB41Y]|uniref:recombinase family protein n=1 Tax=Gordonia sp. NB41Y TaxID=875808 RepID=UPI0006B17168|nr:recombinase family protein [Gordonia sp. NB41Y]KOY49899.1 resolvase [Gordonia sp. NB41Y]WLP91050.1 recombinase family protein [Gordonia sp. NB41Y]
MPSDASTATLLGYARARPRAGSLDEQIDLLTETGVAANRIYTDTTVLPEAERPGMTALLDYARRGDTVVVVGIDRLGRSTPEVMSTVRHLDERGLRLRSLRERIDTTEPAGHMIVGVLASLSELDDEQSPGRRVSTGGARRAGGTVGRPRALTPDQIAQAERMRANGEPVPRIAAALGVSRATLYRTLATKEAR